MEKGEILKKIKSIYIIDNIFNYIKDSTNLQLKLFIYQNIFKKYLI